MSGFPRVSLVKLGFETPENEKRGEESRPQKQRKRREEPGYTPEAREEEEKEEGEEGLIFLPVSLQLDNLRDWAVPGSEGDKGALVQPLSVDSK